MPLNVLVTGATSGIGFATALELCRRGHHVIGSARCAGKGGELVARARQAGCSLEYVELEVTDAASCERAMTEVLSRFEGRLGALVNNAGVAHGGALQDLDDAQLRRQFEVNVFGPLRMARLALGSMQRHGAGRIVNISSFVSRFPMPFLGAYSSSKRALDALGDALRLECADSGIQVISLQPGVYHSAIWDRGPADLSRIKGSRFAASYSRLRPILSSLPRGFEPLPVARKVARILQCRRPAGRYLVGIDARAAVALETMLPRAVLDLGKRWCGGLAGAAASATWHEPDGEAGGVQDLPSVHSAQNIGGQRRDCAVAEGDNVNLVGD